MRTLIVNLTRNEYEELLAKLANELDDYGDQASQGLENSFIKILKAELYDNYFETINIKKFKKKLIK